MKNYVAAKLIQAVEVHQCCLECDKWFQLPSKVVAQLNKDERKMFSAAEDKLVSVPFRKCVCSHCGEEQIAVMFGKYDRPGAPKRSCAVQYVVVK